MATSSAVLQFRTTPPTGQLHNGGVSNFRGSYPVALTEKVLIEARVGESSALVRVSVREALEREIVLDRDLQFSRRAYTSVLDRKKRVDLWADPSFDGREVSLEISPPQGIEINTTSITLTYDDELGVCIGSCSMLATNPMQAVLMARLDTLRDEATVIFRRLTASPKVEFKFVDKDNFGAGRRFQWDLEEENLLLLAAQHRTLSRVLGPALDPSSGTQWPGQHSPQLKAILAEIIAEAYVSRKLQDELPMLGVGPENLIDPVDYEDYRYKTFEDCFAICHEALTPAWAG
jgi:hypothetical protein